MASPLTASAGLARQGVRSAAYYGLGELTGRMARRHAPGIPRYKPERPSPSRNELFAAVWDLMRRDAELVRAGVCPPFPADDGTPLQWLARVRAMIADLPEAARRSAEGEGQEVRAEAERGRSARLLPAEFPLPVRWLSDAGLRAPLRYPGRDAVHGHGQPDAPASLWRRSPNSCAAAINARCSSPISPAAPAAFSGRSWRSIRA